MRIGFNAPAGGPLAGPAPLTALAQGGEAMGFDYAAFSDHVVIPQDISAKYPYTETGEFPAASRGERHEQLTQLAFVAGRTSRLGLVTSVLVVPHRPAVLAAKMLSTIDILSEGRLTVGIGAGWLEEEFQALGAPDFAARGAVTDEYVAAFRTLWTQAEPHFEGRWVHFEKVLFAPKPAKSLPIWIGGESGPAMRRAAKSGDGWYPIGTNPQNPLDSLPRLAAAIAKLRALTVAAGRDPAAVAVAYRVQRYGAGVPDRAGDGERRLFSGSDDAIAGDLRDLTALGVGSIDFGFPGDTVDAALDAMGRFRDDVLAKV